MSYWPLILFHLVFTLRPVFLWPETQMEPIFQMIVYMQFSFGQPNGLSAWSTSLLPFLFTAAHRIGWGSTMSHSRPWQGAFALLGNVSALLHHFVICVTWIQVGRLLENFQRKV